MTAAAQAQAELPTTLSWYRDAANWMVGLSTGALAAGLTYRDDIQSATFGPRFLFLAASVAFLLALLAGIQFYFWLTSYGNQRERKSRIADQLQSATDPEVKARLERESKDADAKCVRAQGRFGGFYLALLWSFHLGVIGYAASTIWLLSQSKASPEPEKAYSIHVAPCCPARCVPPLPDVFRIESTTGQTWYLEGDSAPSRVWRLIGEGDSTTNH